MVTRHGRPTRIGSSRAKICAGVCVQQVRRAVRDRGGRGRVLCARVAQIRRGGVLRRRACVRAGIASRQKCSRSVGVVGTNGETETVLGKWTSSGEKATTLRYPKSIDSPNDSSEPTSRQRSPAARTGTKLDHALSAFWNARAQSPARNASAASHPAGPPAARATPAAPRSPRPVAYTGSHRPVTPRPRPSSRTLPTCRPGPPSPARPTPRPPPIPPSGSGKAARPQQPAARAPHRPVAAVTISTDSMTLPG